MIRHHKHADRPPTRAVRPVIAVLAASVLAIAMSSIGVIPANAYSTTGCKWGSASISYENDAAGDYYATGNLAANSWSVLTDVNMSEVASSNLDVYPEFTGMDGVEGRSNWSCAFGVTSSANARWNTYYTISYSYGAKRAVICHELGHAIGLNHGSGNVIMNPSASSVYNTYGTLSPQTDDINGINAVY